MEHDGAHPMSSVPSIRLVTVTVASETLHSPDILAALARRSRKVWDDFGCLSPVLKRGAIIFHPYRV